MLNNHFEQKTNRNAHYSNKIPLTNCFNYKNKNYKEMIDFRLSTILVLQQH